MQIDIICPLYQAEKYLVKLDKSIRKQENVNIHEIRYIVTKSEDHTEELLKKMQANYCVIGKEEFSHSLTREKEAFHSTADILVFITQDIKIEKKDWLYHLTKDIASGKVAAAYSRQLCDNDSIEKYTREKNYPNQSKVISKEDIEQLGLETFFFSDASSAICREIFVKLKGYDGKDLPISEDMYLAYKLIMNGYQIKYCADSEVIHSHQFTLKQLYNRYKLTGKFFKQNAYLDKYGTNQSGGKMAMYIFKRILQDKNVKAMIRFLPDMAARWVGMKIGKMK